MALKENKIQTELKIVIQQSFTARSLILFVGFLHVCTVTSELGRLKHVPVMEKTVTVYELSHSRPPMVHCVFVELQYLA